MIKKLLVFWAVGLMSAGLGGCSTLDKAQKADILEMQVLNLRKELKECKEECKAQLTEKDGLLAQKDQAYASSLNAKDREIQRLVKEKERQIQTVEKQKKDVIAQKEKKISDLEQAQMDLEKSLKNEIADYQAKLEMTERGLVLTFLAEIFFDSGKAVIHTEAKPTLKRVADILNDKVSGSHIAVEGHTDNQPIQYSGWKSNWELSSARALSVVHFFIDEAGVKPQRLSAVGYGEFRPVESNSAEAGRKQNRRVEIVIQPANVKKVEKPLTSPK